MNTAYKDNPIPFVMMLLNLPKRTNESLSNEQTKREKDFPMRQSGTVKFFNGSKGFGFITPDEGGSDVFVHISAVQASGLPELQDNMRISFETEPDKRGKGPKAVDLQLEG